jgi:hypothetical protein
MNEIPRGVAAVFAAMVCASLAADASAQNAPAPSGMQAGGLAPPSSQSGPPAPQPLGPSPTQMQLQQASAEDSGRGLEFVYFDVEGGVSHVSLGSLHASGDLVAGGVRSSDVGSVLGVATGARLLFFTVGPRFRFGHFHDWDLWSLDLEAGWHIPLGNLEPYAIVGAGYSRLGRSADAVLGSGNDVSVKGFNVRIGGGFDYYVTNVLSVGALASVEMMRLSRGAVAQPGYGADASGLGLGLTASAVVGLHF